MNDSLNIFTHALALIDQGKKVALATVMSTWGSAPRPSGSHMLICEDGSFMGSVSGGCVESAVMVEAQTVMEDGACRVLEYGVSDDNAFSVGLACGGRMKVLVEPLAMGAGPTRPDLEHLVQAMADRIPVGLEVNTAAWARRLIVFNDAPDDFRTGRGGILNGDMFRWLGQPSPRLIIVGAVHIAQHLSAMAQRLGYDVTVIDPRTQFATADRFPDVTLSHDWPDDALGDTGVDSRTAVVTLTHDRKIDTPALVAAVASDAFYIGALGSTRTHAKRRSTMLELGVNDLDIGRIHGPVGLDIRAATPAEIAVSILAQMTQSLRTA